MSKYDEKALGEDSPNPRDRNGWDDKLRQEKKAVLVNPESLSDLDGSDDDAFEREEIVADEDLLDDYASDTDEIDLVHRRISSIPALHLKRFRKVQRICLRQNRIVDINFPGSIGLTLQDLDLYDNLISHLRGLDDLVHLKSLDLSFNKLKHIKNIENLKEMTDLYFVQNRISKIEGLDGLTQIRNLELAANRIREIENLDTLINLEQLWLGKNKITQLKNLSPLSNLKILSIQSNRLTHLEGLDGLESLEELYVSHNALKQISGLGNCPKLRVIDVSNNMIGALENLHQVTALEEFWASWNQFSSFQEVERELRDKKQLGTVYFEGNPLQTDHSATYRNKVRLAIPQIQQIDATFVQVT